MTTRDLNAGIDGHLPHTKCANSTSRICGKVHTIDVALPLEPIRIHATPDVLSACGAPPGRPLALYWPNNKDGKTIVGNMGTGALHLEHTLEDLQDIGRLDNEFQDRPRENFANQFCRKGRLRQHHRPRNPDVRNNCNTGCATLTEKNLAVANFAYR